jgi:hypothetical protein
VSGPGHVTITTGGTPNLSNVPIGTQEQLVEPGFVLPAIPPGPRAALPTPPGLASAGALGLPVFAEIPVAVSNQAAGFVTQPGPQAARWRAAAGWGGRARWDHRREWPAGRPDGRRRGASVGLVRSERARHGQRAARGRTCLRRREWFGRDGACRGDTEQSARRVRPEEGGVSPAESRARRLGRLPFLLANLGHPPRRPRAAPVTPCPVARRWVSSSKTKTRT